MITLTSKLKQLRQKGEVEQNTGINSKQKESSNKYIDIRYQLLTKELTEIKHIVGVSEICFSDPHVLHNFRVFIKPDDGMWKGGKFLFELFVPEEYNMKPPVVKCLTKLWHPNINVEGDVCLSILREYSLDGAGWAPTRSLKDVIWGLQSIFQDLVDFKDPLNNEAAQEYYEHPQRFRKKVQSYISEYASEHQLMAFS